MANIEADKLSISLSDTPGADTYLLKDHRIPEVAAADAGKSVVAGDPGEFGLAKRSRIERIEISENNGGMYATGLDYGELEDCDMLVAKIIDAPPSYWNGTVAMYSQETGSYWPVTMTFGGNALRATDVAAGDRLQLEVDHDMVVLSIDRWGKDISAKQDALVGSGIGQNIKTVNGNSLPGTGNIQLGKGVAVISSTAAADNYSAVTCALMSPGMDLTESGGIILLAYFNHDMPAHGRLTITDGGSSTECFLSDIHYPDALSHALADGDIKAGDVCLFQYFYNGGVNMTTFLVNLTRDVYAEPRETHHVTTVSSDNASVTLTCAANERAFHFVEVASGVSQFTLIVNTLNDFQHTLCVVSLEEIALFRVILKNKGNQVDVIYSSGNLNSDGSIYGETKNGTLMKVKTVTIGGTVHAFVEYDRLSGWAATI